MQHLGATDPVTEGFAFGGALDAVGPVYGDLGLDAWRTSVTTTLSRYTQLLTPEQQAQAVGADLLMSVTLRIVQGLSPPAGNTWAGFAQGSALFALNFGATTNGDPFVSFGNAGATPMFVLEGSGSTYHNYQLRYDATSGTASMWVDDIERFNGIAGIPGYSGWGLTWGEGQGGISEANWNYISLEIIPEPSSLALLGCGAVLLAGHWLRRFRRRG